MRDCQHFWEICDILWMWKPGKGNGKLLRYQEPIKYWCWRPHCQGLSTCANNPWSLMTLDSSCTKQCTPHCSKGFLSHCKTACPVLITVIYTTLLRNISVIQSNSPICSRGTLFTTECACLKLHRDSSTYVEGHICMSCTFTPSRAIRYTWKTCSLIIWMWAGRWRLQMTKTLTDLLRVWISFSVSCFYSIFQLLRETLTDKNSLLLMSFSKCFTEKMSKDLSKMSDTFYNVAYRFKALTQKEWTIVFEQIEIVLQR